MAKESASDTIMASDKLKPLLALSKREPVNAAIGITAEGEGFILLDKKAKPKSVVSMLKASAAKAKLQLNPSSIRYGRAEVDTDYDPGMVRFFINKEAPGNLRVKLVEVVKKIAYQKVELNIDPSIDAEEGAEGDIPPPPPPPAAAARPDPAALKARLVALVQRIPQALAADPTQKDALMAMAKQAQILLGTNNLVTAGETMDQLESAMDAMPAPSAAAAQPPSAGAPAAGAVAYAKSRLAWLSVRKKMETDLESLRKSILEYYKDDAILGALDKRYGETVAPILTTLDEMLADRLDMATNAADPEERRKLVGESQDIIKGYQAFIASDPTLKELDTNPFVPLATVKTMTATLATLASAIH